MSVNSSSSSNNSLSHHDFFMSNYIFCLLTRPTSFIHNAFAITNIFLLLPLCIFIIYHSVRKRLKKNGTGSAASISHSDCLTYHMVTMELIAVSGSILCCWGNYSQDKDIMINGTGVYCFTSYGQLFIHILTCVERYLAVVHPITYMRLRNERGIRIRNICIGCVWLLCFAATILVILGLFAIVDIFLLTSTLTAICFCSLSVVSILIRPGPGHQGEGRQRADQSKRRAFYTIVTILGVLLIRFSWGLVLTTMYVSLDKVSCVFPAVEGWINLPSSLVLPLLFLHKEGKLVCCRKDSH